MDQWLKIYLVVCATIIVLILAVIIVDLVIALKRKDNSSKGQEVPPVVQQEQIQEPIVVERVVEKVVEVPAEPVVEDTEGKVLVDIDELGVKFSKKLTLREKYKQMQPDSRERFDKVEHYLSNVEDIKVIENDRFIEFKFGHTRIARITIKKDVPHVECFIVSPEFTETVKESKVSVKAAGPIVKIKSDADVDAVRQIVDVNVGVYKEMKHPKKKKVAQE